MSQSINFEDMTRISKSVRKLTYCKYELEQENPNIEIIKMMLDESIMILDSISREIIEKEILKYKPQGL